MLLIYVPKITSRLKYAFSLVFNQVLSLPYELTVEKEVFTNHEGPKLSYAPQPIDECFHIQSKGLLFESGIVDQELSVFNWEDTKAIYPVGPKSFIPFDIFSASFFLASRYEEYLPHIRDLYDRFDAQSSIAYSNGFLHQPVVNKWCKFLKRSLSEYYPELRFKESKYRFKVSIDIDNAYAYLEKGFVRTLAGIAKSILTFNFSDLKERIQVLWGVKRDPYDTYDFQYQCKKKYGIDFIYFFLLGDYGMNDKNIPVESRKFQSLIKSLADYGEVGIHPSYGSNNSTKQLKKEIMRLNEVINREVEKSRQHFLKMRLPITYRNLIEQDIKEDYTMGYASDYGFRAGLCTPFFFYDLDLEVETNLKVMPFAIMEGTLKYYQKVLPEEAMEHIRPLIDEVKAVDGQFISLWHNDTLNDKGLWKGWRKVFIDMIEYSTNYESSLPRE